MVFTLSGSRAQTLGNLPQLKPSPSRLQLRTRLASLSGVMSGGRQQMPPPSIMRDMLKKTVSLLQLFTISKLLFLSKGHVLRFLLDLHQAKKASNHDDVLNFFNHDR